MHLWENRTLPVTNYGGEWYASTELGSVLADQYLQIAGYQGWELVAVLSDGSQNMRNPTYHLFFKRPLQSGGGSAGVGEGNGSASTCPEHKTLNVPLALTRMYPDSDDNRAWYEGLREQRDGYYKIVLLHLRQAVLDGWQADDSIDPASARAEGRLEVRSDERAEILESVSIHMSRVAA